MKYLVLSFLSIIVIACGDNNRMPVIKADTLFKSIKQPPKPFISNFDSLNRDSILVYPRMSSNASDEPGYPFSGKVLKSVNFKEIDSSRFEHPVKRKMRFYASYNIPLGKDHTGLLLRTPSIYWESAMYLLLWNNKLNKAVDQLQVAEWWGDAGDLVFIQSWMLDLEKNNPKILVVKNITKPKNINNIAETVTTDSVYTYTIKDNKFKLDAKSGTDREYLRKKYNVTLKNVTG